MKNNRTNKYEGVIATRLPEQNNIIHLILQGNHYEALSIINEKYLAPKCSKKSRKNEKSGECEPTNNIHRTGPISGDNVNRMKKIIHKTGIIYPRCPRRSRRNKVSGECEPTNNVVNHMKKIIHKTGIIYPRCPKKSCRNKKSGNCEPTVRIQISAQISRSGATNGELYNILAWHFGLVRWPGY